MQSHNVNRNSGNGACVDDHSKHSRSPITLSADDDVSNERNLELLREEFAKTKPRNDMLKELMACTYPFKR